jgi:hypothetical protein
MANKECKRCEQIKEISDFYKSNKISRNTDSLGYDYYCKRCRLDSHLISVKNNSVKCTVPECTKPHYAKGVCRMHEARWKRNGSYKTKREMSNEK